MTIINQMESPENSDMAQDRDLNEEFMLDPVQAGESSKKAPSAFRTISEVADELNVQQHVLRLWETKFTQVKPLKRGGGRRYYRPEDVAMLKKIHTLLYTEGYTIKGVQKLLKGYGRQQILAGLSPEVSSSAAAPVSAPAPVAAPVRTSAPAAAATVTGNVAKSAPAAKPGMSDKQRSILNAMLGDLKELRDLLKGEGE
jgi:DNA-binding transcriptional MerR regulator